MVTVYDGIKGVGLSNHANGSFEDIESCNDATFILASVSSLCSSINRIDDIRAKEALVSIVAHYGFLCQSAYGVLFWDICDTRQHKLSTNANEIDVAANLTKIVTSTMLNIRGKQNAEISAFMELCAYVDQRMPNKMGVNNG